MFSYSKKMLFINHFLTNDKLGFNSNAFHHFTNYIGFQYYAVSNLKNSAFMFLKRSIEHSPNKSKFKFRQKKLFNSQFRF